MELGKLSLAAASAAIFVAYWAYKIIYNLYFHRLAQFPGPWWAAASYLPELYYDIVQGGQYYKKVIEMHEKYGNDHKHTLPAFGCILTNIRSTRTDRPERALPQ
jgi:hypothetical protein